MKPSASFLSAFFSFSLNPNQEGLPDLTFSSKISYLRSSFLLIFIGSFVAVFINLLLVQTGVMPKFRNTADASILAHYNLISFYIIAVLAAPVIEELAFRTLLVFSKVNLTVSSGFLFYTLASSIVGYRYSLAHAEAYYNMAGSCVFAAVVWTSLNNSTFFYKLKLLWDEHFSVIFYASAALFAYLHLFNFDEITFDKIAFSPFILLQFFVCAVVFGYARIRLGLGWSIVLHTMLNTFVTLLHASYKA